MSASRPGILALLALILSLATACSDDESPAAPPGGGTKAITSSFDSDLDGWTAGLSSTDWGLSGRSGANGGSARLDGVGDSDPGPNAWITKEFDLPSTARTLAFEASAHDRGSGTGFLRVRLEENGNDHTLIDWEKYETGSEGYEFLPRSADISAYAGETATIWFELNDTDGGGNNQVYLDNIQVQY